MEIKNILKKPYTEIQRIEFVVENNHKLGYEIRETEEELEAWGFDENDLLIQAKQTKIQENDTLRDEALNQGVMYRDVLFDSDTDQKVNLLAVVSTMETTSAPLAELCTDESPVSECEVTTAAGEGTTATSENNSKTEGLCRNEGTLTGTFVERVARSAEGGSLTAQSSEADSRTIIWYGKDNQPLECDKEDLINIGGLITQLHTFCWNKNAEIKLLINNAETIEEVEAIEIDYTMPVKAEETEETT